MRRGKFAQRRFEQRLAGGGERVARGRVETRGLYQRRLEDGAASPGISHVRKESEGPVAKWTRRV